MPWEECANRREVAACPPTSPAAHPGAGVGQRRRGGRQLGLLGYQRHPQRLNFGLLRKWVVGTMKAGEIGTPSAR
jgi:hypothetical protein